jgi:hypothetical protein
MTAAVDRVDHDGSPAYPTGEPSPELVNAAVEYITGRDHTWFEHLQKSLDGRGIASHGDYVITLIPNGFAWIGMSGEMVSLVNALQADDRVTAGPEDVTEILWMGGAILSYPRG